MKTKRLRHLIFGMASMIFIPLILTTYAYSSFQPGTPEDIVERIETTVKKNTHDKATINNLIQALKNPDSDIRIRERAAWALGELRSTTAIPALIEAAQHKGLLIRSAALGSLVRLRSKNALSVITSIAEKDPILSMRQRATLALGLIKSDTSIPALVKLSSDPLPEIQGAAALSMAALQSKKNDFSQVLKEMAQESDLHVKGRAQVGLDLISGKNKPIREHLKSDDMDVRLFSANYFRSRGTSADLSVLKEALNGEAQDDIRGELTESIKAINRRAEELKKRKAREAAKAAANKKP